MYLPSGLWPRDYYCLEISYLDLLFARAEGALNLEGIRITLFYYTLNYLKSIKIRCFYI